MFGSDFRRGAERHPGWRKVTITPEASARTATPASYEHGHSPPKKPCCNADNPDESADVVPEAMHVVAGSLRHNCVNTKATTPNRAQEDRPPG